MFYHSCRCLFYILLFISQIRLFYPHYSQTVKILLL